MVYKLGDKVRVVDVNKMFLANHWFKNGDETEIGWNDNFKMLGLIVPNALGAVYILFDDEFDGIEKVEN